jgi:N-acetylglucosamine-6-phosphate deacetylase
LPEREPAKAAPRVARRPIGAFLLNDAMTPFDLQLNGYQGVDFNADGLTAADLRRACEGVRADGGGCFLATVITDRIDRMAARIARLAELRADDPLIASALAGIHVEGPCISGLAGFVGAHPREHVLEARVDVVAPLVSAGQGLVRLFTLAPEHDAGQATIRWLAERGILVAAGHCDPTAAQLERAIDAGLSGFTHLGNGCPAQLHRHDNIIQRVLASDRLRWVTIIPDGVHLPPSMIRTVIRAVGIDRVIAVTDATAAGGMGPGRFRLASREVLVDDDGAAWAPDRSHLVGSTASMGRVIEVLGRDVGLSAGEVERIIAVNPARTLGLESA